MGLYTTEIIIIVILSILGTLVAGYVVYNICRFYSVPRRRGGDCTEMAYAGGMHGLTM
jgi:hypothetical protein